MFRKRIFDFSGSNHDRACIGPVFNQQIYNSTEKDETRVEPVKKRSSEFWIKQPSENVKITKPHREELVIDLWQP